MVLSNKTSGRMVVLSIILAVAAVSTAWAEPISTDRPDFVESSRTVGEGRLQFEMSVAGEHDKTDGIKTTTFTTPVLIRYGIAPAWELRLEGDGYTRQETHDSVLSTRDTESGVSETSIGVKWHTHDGGGAAPSIGWLLHADIESGSRAFRGYGARPSLRAVFEWELPNGFSTGIMPGFYWTGPRLVIITQQALLPAFWASRGVTAFAHLLRSPGSTLRRRATAALLLPMPLARLTC